MSLFSDTADNNPWLFVFYVRHSLLEYTYKLSLQDSF